MDLKGLIDNVIEKAEDNITMEEGDYINPSDGLLYCGKCNTKKQTQIELFGEIKRPKCLCECAAAKKEAELEERRKRDREERIKEIRKSGFPESDMFSWNFANDDMKNPQITTAMQNYVDNFTELKKKGKGLLLHGSVGTGKTFAACEVANALIDKGYPVLVTNFARILNQLQATFEKQDYIDDLNRFSLLILDDLGIERDTDFAREQVYNIIDGRYRAGLPMIITTNLSIEKIKNPDNIEYGRIYDRILERCFPIEVSGGSRRRQAIREGYNEMKNLLGL